MKDFLSLAKARHSTYKFSDRDIPASAIKKILEAARWAPSCSNSQPWHFIVVKEKGQIDRLMRVAYYGYFHYDPKMMAVLLLDNNCWKTKKKICTYAKGTDIHDAYLSIAMPALQMCLEAADLGIGSALITLERRRAAKILGVPNGMGVVLGVGFGFEKRGFRKEHVRAPLREMVSDGKYGKAFKTR